MKHLPILPMIYYIDSVLIVLLSMTIQALQGHEYIRPKIESHSNMNLFYHWPNKTIMRNFVCKLRENVLNAEGMSSDDIKEYIRENIECSICGNNFKSLGEELDNILFGDGVVNDIRVMFCMNDNVPHMFHTQCFLVWVCKYNNLACPMCRVDSSLFTKYHILGILCYSVMNSEYNDDIFGNPDYISIKTVLEFLHNKVEITELYRLPIYKYASLGDGQCDPYTKAIFNDMYNYYVPMIPRKTAYEQFMNLDLNIERDEISIWMKHDLVFMESLDTEKLRCLFIKAMNGNGDRGNIEYICRLVWYINFRRSDEFSSGFWFDIIKLFINRKYVNSLPKIYKIIYGRIRFTTEKTCELINEYLKYLEHPNRELENKESEGFHNFIAFLISTNYNIDIKIFDHLNEYIKAKNAYDHTYSCVNIAITDLENLINTRNPKINYDDIDTYIEECNLLKFTVLAMFHINTEETPSIDLLNKIKRFNYSNNLTKYKICAFMYQEYPIEHLFKLFKAQNKHCMYYKKCPRDNLGMMLNEYILASKDNTEMFENMFYHLLTNNGSMFSLLHFINSTSASTYRLLERKNKIPELFNSLLESGFVLHAAALANNTSNSEEYIMMIYDASYSEKEWVKIFYERIMELTSESNIYNSYEEHQYISYEIIPRNLFQALKKNFIIYFCSTIEKCFNNKKYWEIIFTLSSSIREIKGYDSIVQDKPVLLKEISNNEHIRNYFGEGDLIEYLDILHKTFSINIITNGNIN